MSTKSALYFVKEVPVSPDYVARFFRLSIFLSKQGDSRPVRSGYLWQIYLVLSINAFIQDILKIFCAGKYFTVILNGAGGTVTIRKVDFF